MSSWVAWLIAAVSTTAFLVLWFWEVRRVLRSRRSVVESAAAQLSACRRQAAGVRYDPELAQILARSESIYRQAVAHYNDTLCKPWCRLPGHLLGFGRDTGEDDLWPPRRRTISCKKKVSRSQSGSLFAYFFPSSAGAAGASAACLACSSSSKTR